MAETRKEVEEALRNSFLFPLLNPDERDRFIAAAQPCRTIDNVAIWLTR